MQKARWLRLLSTRTYLVISVVRSISGPTHLRVIKAPTEDSCRVQQTLRTPPLFSSTSDPSFMYMIHPLHLLSAVFQLSVLLAIVPPLRQCGSPTHHRSKRRRVVSPGVLQVSISALAFLFENGPVTGLCIPQNSESIHKNTLTTSVSVKGGENHNTVERCTEKCKLEGYGMAGVAAGRECCTYFNLVSLMDFPLLTNLCSLLQDCGSSIENGGETIPSENCMSACSGDSSQACGGTNSILVYYTD
ncbi:hypothetical protein BJY52DRAFT_423025 [Lactarius psammicola]|nr:hypothetical protein BJY52DRAFT_423025 [Lactarius psammicola]